MSQEGEFAPLVTSGFERETGIGVDVQALPWTAAHQKLLTAYVGESLPDVLMVKNGWLPELAMLGAFGAPPAGSSGLLANRLPSALDAVRVGGRAVAAPWMVDSWAQYYRPDLLAEAGYAEPPGSWAEWTRMALSLKRRRPDGFIVLHLLDWPEPLMNFAAQTGAPMLRDRDTRGNFTAPGFREALAFYKSTFDQGFAAPLIGAEMGDSLIALRRGFIAILPSNALTMGDLRRRTSWFPDRLWQVARTPGPSGPAAGIANGYALAVGPTTHDPARAWRLVEYLCRPDIQARFFAVTGDLPSRRDAWNAPELARDPAAAVFGTQAADSVAPPAIPEWERIVTEVQLVAEAMVRGRFGVDGAAAEMNKRADKILEKRRSLLDRGLLA